MLICAYRVLSIAYLRYEVNYCRVVNVLIPWMEEWR